MRNLEFMGKYLLNNKETKLFRKENKRTHHCNYYLIPSNENINNYKDYKVTATFVIYYLINH